jgi:two-component system OmpR family response regulator
MHVLLIEDDLPSAQYLVKGLRECGHQVEHAADGADGLHLALAGQHDVIVIDRLLPNRDGLSILRMLRADDRRTPVLILSALGEVDDRVEGLRAGGDDYLAKPYAFSELLARLEALSRRATPAAVVTSTLQVADLALDLTRHSVTRGGRLIRLQPREYRLLECLMRHCNTVVTRTMLLEQVWEFHFDPQTNVIDAHISRLRAKIDRGEPVPLLHTVRGSGYMLAETPPA